MLRSIVSVVLMCFFTFGGYVAAATKKHSTTSSKKHRSAKHTSHRNTQQAPTPQRYMEIQQALADKGYYKGPVSGQWGPDSIDALKRFQQDQNLNGTGKLDSMSLIALGLGPKRNLTAQSGSSETPVRPSDDHRRSEGSERP